MSDIREHRRSLATTAGQRLPELVRRVVEAIPAEPGVVGATTRVDVVSAAMVGSMLTSLIATVLLDKRPDPRVVWRERLREIGAAERRGGRDLTEVAHPVRRAVRLMWDVLTDVAREGGVPSESLITAADGFFAFSHGLCEELKIGYTAANEMTASGRTALLTALLENKAPSDLAAQARAVGWPLPEQVVAVTAARPFRLRPGYDPRILGTVSGEATTVLVPADSPELGDLTEGWPHVRFSVGPTVGVRDAHRSAHYATALLRLAKKGIVPGAPVLRATHHLAELLVFGHDTMALSAHFGTTIQTRLAALSAKQQSSLLHTLALWLRHHGDASRVAVEMGVHVQTIHHRIHHLRRLLGDEAFGDDQRFILRVALDTHVRPRSRTRDATESG